MQSVASAAPARMNRAARRGGVLMQIVSVLLVLALVGGGTAAYLNRGEKEADYTRDIRPAEVISFDITTIANGELQANKQTEVRNPLDSGTRITELIEEGTVVEKGDVMVRLATDTLEDRLLEAERNYSTAANNLKVAENELEIQKSDNESSLREARLTLELAELELQKWREGDVVETRKQLTTAVEKTERQVERLTEKYEKSKQLLEQDFISEDEKKLDHIALLEAEANLEIARTQLDVYQKYTHLKEKKQRNSDVEEAAASLERVKRRNETQLESKESDVAYNKEVVEKRKEELDKVKSQLDACVVRAPTDGLVVYATSLERDRWDDDGPLKVGTELHPNEELIVLPDTTQMEAVVKIHESLISRVNKGQNVYVSIDALNGRVVEGEVRSIAVLAESGGWRDPNNREYEVTISLKEPSHSDIELKPAMRCEAEIILDEVHDTLAVPVQSIFNEGDVTFVHVPRQGRFRRLPIAVGRRSSDYAEIVGGLEAGQTVLLRRPNPGEIINEEFDQERVSRMAKIVEDLNESRHDGETKLAGPAGTPADAADAEQDASDSADAGDEAEEVASEREKESEEAPAGTPSETG